MICRKKKDIRRRRVVTDTLLKTYERIFTDEIEYEEWLNRYLLLSEFIKKDAYVEITSYDKFIVYSLNTDFHGNKSLHFTTKH